MILFTIYDLFTVDMMGLGEKKTETYNNENKGEKFPVRLPSHPSVYIIGGRLFSGSKRTENKPDLP